MSDFLDDEPYEFSLQEVEGERVVLRPLGEADVQPLFELIDESREFLSEHLPWPAEECRTPEDVSAKIDAWDMQAQMANGACWGIFEKIPEGAGSNDSRGKIAGCIMLGWVQWKNRSATVSYWLGQKFCGRGLATETLILASSEAFAMGLNRLELTSSVRNPKSAAVARRAGFQEEGLCREYERIHGHFEDHLRFSLLAKDFC
ncbi:GNAT family N-acetyltransferase [Fibrobacter sp. UWB12]|uniref:GNAT family N-acetyltransferase n=1 Tax=Fibrobacter sp. UWB12 TaxID=1896203 RepID=UPI00092386E8|nr:GNAT family protein [Fibrobacter sp. UWB12]SHK74278.1 ribosomal-protein-serine acetyltransferase [Fibrobacter sp. UWB12]